MKFANRLEVRHQSKHMKFLVNKRKGLLLAAAALSLAYPLRAQGSSPLVGPRPSEPGDEKIVKSAREGYLRVYTPEVPIYDEDGFIWSNNDNYRVVPESKGPVQTWFNERPLALKPGIYDVEVDYPSIDVVEPRDQNNYGKVRAAVKGGQITDIWLDDSDRPNLSNSKSSELTRDKYGDIIGYRDK